MRDAHCNLLGTLSPNKMLRKQLFLPIELFIFIKIALVLFFSPVVLETLNIYAENIEIPYDYHSGITPKIQNSFDFTIYFANLMKTYSYRSQV